MFYVVSFDGCGIESPLRSRSAIAALALAEEAERNGCENIVVTVPGGDMLSVGEFAAQHCAPGKIGNA